jgi:hypothetical protein
VSQVLSPFRATGAYENCQPILHVFDPGTSLPIIVACGGVV